MTNEQLKELADLRVAIQDLKYQLTQKHEEIEDRESAIYATGYYKGIEYKRLKDLSEDKESFVLHAFTCDCGNYWNLDKYPPRLIEKAKNETLDTRSYLIGRYDNLRELSNKEMIEPVAWMFEYGTDRGDATNPISWYTNIKFEKPYLSGLIRNIEPLYTHPMRELTNEEINEIIEKHQRSSRRELVVAILKKAKEHE